MSNLLNYGPSDQRLSYSSRNIVVIGANGSGKSSLMRSIDQYNGECIIISAHKNLSLKQGQFKGQEDSWLTQQKSNFESPTSGGGAKPTSSNTIQNDFNQAIELIIREYEKVSVKALNAGQNLTDIKRKLDTVMELWNSIFIDKVLEFDVDNQRITCRIKSGGDAYDVENLSDGERCALYILLKLGTNTQAKYFVIDEPETYLNSALVNSIFDLCEVTFSNASFIYLSHDLDFVTSRKDCDGFWVKNYIYPSTWDIQPLENADIPTEVIARVVGTKRQKILFVESTADKDARLYQAIYPEFKVWPVGGCENVISYTKAFNANVEKFNKQYFGLIDRDLRSNEELAALANNSIYATPVAIYENLFLQKEVVSFVFTCLGKSDFDAKYAKLENAVKAELGSQNFKIAYVKSKLQQSFNQQLDQIADGSSTFNPDIPAYEKEVNKVATKDYATQLAAYNQKNLTGCVKELSYKWNDWQEQVLNIFNTDKADEFRNIWLKFMPTIGTENA